MSDTQDLMIHCIKTKGRIYECDMQAQRIAQLEAALEVADAGRNHANELLTQQAEKVRVLEAERDELKRVLRRLWIACPTSLRCHDFHHSKHDQHRHDEPCKPSEEYLAAIEQANAAIAKVKP